MGFVFQDNGCSLGIKSMDTVNVFTWLNLYIYIYIYIYIYTHTQIYIYIYTYTHSLMVHGDRKFWGEVDTSNSDV